MGWPRATLAAAAVLTGLVGAGSCSSTTTNHSSGGAAGGGTGGADGSAVDADAGLASECRGSWVQPICTDPPAIVPACPSMGQTLKYACIDPKSGDVELENLSDDRTYWCSLNSTQPGGDYSCTSEPTPDDEVNISSLGTAPSPCACGTLFTIGTPHCTYDCVAAD